MSARLNSGVTLSDGKEAGQQVMTGVVYITPDYFERVADPGPDGALFH